MLTFQELYEYYAADVYRFAYWLSGNRFEAEDITSETFVRAWGSTNPIRTKTLQAYLFTIARNVYLGQLRQGKKDIYLKDNFLDPNPGPDKHVEYRLELQTINQVMQTLPEIDRAAFILRVQHDMPYAEIARTLGITISASKVKVHRVR
jgi:RNA polymerase sigma-70 factor (ECF subfamily)